MVERPGAVENLVMLRGCGIGSHRSPGSGVPNAQLGNDEKAYCPTSTGICAVMGVAASTQVSGFSVSKPISR